MTKKIAFTIFRYGEGIFGGTEAHCRMLAERLRPYYQVEILTTTIRRPGAPELDFPAGETVENGILVRRFKTEAAARTRRQRIPEKQKGPTHPLSSGPVENTLSAGVAAPRLDHECRSRTPLLRMSRRVRALAGKIRPEHKDEYAAILPVCYYFSSTVCTVLAAPEKCILIPTAHPEKPLYYAIYTQIFTRVAHIAFNTAAERRLCRRIFGCRMSPNSLVGCGIEKAAPAAWDSVKSRYGLPEHYVLYVGRMHPQKISNVISDFLRYKQEHGGDIKLVMAGPGDPKIATVVSPEIIFTDAVSEAEKSALIRHATVMVNPSQLESLSLLLLEALSNGIPMLVNGKCRVMKDHCKSSGAAFWYDSSRDFRNKLHRLISDPELRRTMSEKGPAYVREHYDWSVIIPKLRTLIESL